jgi:hypothetical protein
MDKELGVAILKRLEAIEQAIHELHKDSDAERAAFARKALAGELFDGGIRERIIAGLQPPQPGGSMLSDWELPDDAPADMWPKDGARRWTTILYPGMRPDGLSKTFPSLTETFPAPPEPPADSEQKT